MRSYLRFFSLLTLLGVLFASCSKELSVDPDISKIDSSSLATLSFKSTPDSFVTGQQVGDFIINSSADTSYISLPVVVGKAGAYNLRAVSYYGTDSLVFVGKGYASAKDSIIKLYPIDNSFNGLAVGSYIGVPSKANIISQGGIATGYFLMTSVVISNAPTTASSDSIWSLTLDGTAVSGTFTVLAAQQGVLGMTGQSSDGVYTFILSFTMPTAAVTQPLVMTSSDGTSKVSVSLEKGGVTFKGSTDTPNSTTTITINQYDPTTKEISGTFSGTLVDVTNGTATTYNVSNGTFKGKM